MRTIHARFIEEPVKRIRIKVLQRPCYNVIFRPERWEEMDVLCETQLGALKIAKYHFHSSDHFELLGEVPPKNLDSNDS